MTYSHLGTRALLLSAVAMTVFVSAAHAGFEWKGPVAPPPAPQTVAPGPQELPPLGAPLGGVSGDMSGLEPVITWDNQGPGAMPAVKAGNMPAVKAGNVEQADISAPAADGGGEVLEGFGTSLPLAIALQQVAPAGYRVSFAPGVDPGAPASWSGGKPWKQVLSDMLAAQGLSYKIDGDNAIVVGHFAGSKTQSPPQTASANMPPVMEAPVPLAPPPPPAMAQPPAPPAPAPERVLIGRAAQPGASSGEETVSIRRDKPASLLEKLGLQHLDSDNDDPWAAGKAVRKTSSEVAAQKPVTVTQKTVTVAKTVAPVPPPVPAAEPPASDMPIALKAETVAEKPAVAAPAPVPAAPAGLPAWHAAKGQTLRDVLKDWSNAAGVDLYWSIDYDYRLESDVGFDGGYDDAVGRLLDRFTAAKPQPYGQLHQAAGGPRVLVIKAYGVAG